MKPSLLIEVLRKLFSSNKVKLLCIGMEESKCADNFYGAKKGITNLYNRIKPRCSYSKLLISEEATKANVIKEMQKVCDSDLAIIVYNGHGGQTKTHQNEKDGKDEFICLYDAYMIDNEIWSIISKAKGRVFTIFDCCYSETMFQFSPSKTTFCNSPIDLLCWSSCAENAVSYGKIGYGGMLTIKINSKAKPALTYEEVWKKLIQDEELTSYETVKQTILGNESKFKKKKIFN